MSWNKLLSIYREAAYEAANPRPVSACPNDGEPLRAAPDGRLRCPFDGWTPNDALGAAS